MFHEVGDKVSDGVLISHGGGFNHLVRYIAGAGCGVFPARPESFHDCFWTYYTKRVTNILCWGREVSWWQRREVSDTGGDKRSPYGCALYIGQCSFVLLLLCHLDDMVDACSVVTMVLLFPVFPLSLSDRFPSFPACCFFCLLVFIQ